MKIIQIVTIKNRILTIKNEVIMKKIFVMAVMATLMFASCGTTKTVQTTIPSTQSTNPFGPVTEVPAAEHDTDEYFGATGIATGAHARMGALQLLALTNAQDMVRQKMKHAYKGMVSNYMQEYGNNVGTDIKEKLERAGDQIIDVIVNETQASKGPLFSNVDDKGNVTCFIGIRVSKKMTTDKIADYVSEDEELKIDFKESQYRERMQQAFKDYKENK